MLSTYTMYVLFTAICLPWTNLGSEMYLVIGVTSSCGGSASPGSRESTSCTARSPGPSSLPRGILLLGILAGGAEDDAGSAAVGPWGRGELRRRRHRRSRLEVGGRGVSQ